MKPASLSVRLGVMVGLMSACLVVSLTGLAYSTLTHQLDTFSRQDLHEKISQIEHTLIELGSTGAVTEKPHSLLDQVRGHDNLSLLIVNASPSTKVLLSLGTTLPVPVPSNPIITPSLTFQSFSQGHGSRYLTAAKALRLPSGENIGLQLTLDRRSDDALISAFLSSTLVALPMLLLLIGGVTWLIVQRGLYPLREFHKVAAMVSAQDLSHRLSVARLPRELAELAHSINFMLHRLDTDVQQLTQFSDDLAHELRSPLNNLLGKAQVALSRERPAEEYRAVMESCVEEYERLARMVADMLFLAQVSNPSSPLPLEKIQLETEAAKVIEMFEISAEDKRINIRLNGRGFIWGDRLMVQRALSNLLSNAIRHGHPGSRIEVNVQATSEYQVLAVSNHGSGIEADHLPHLFDRFYRAQASRSRHQGGTGLGLAIVRSIMSLHEGHVDASSELGRKTEFRLWFPIASDRQT